MSEHTYVCTVLTDRWPDGKVSDLGERYVVTLYEMIRKFAAYGADWSFTCLTDREAITGVSCLPVPKGIWTCFSKLYLFSTQAFPVGARILFFDLDTCLTGSWEPLTRVPLDKMVMLRNKVVSLTLPASGVMSWRVTPDTQRIWSEFEPLARKRPPYTHPRTEGWSMPKEIRTDEHWLYKYLQPDNWVGWQDLLPNTFSSYKEEIVRYGKNTTPIVYFHGRPRPHEVKAPWNPFRP